MSRSELCSLVEGTPALELPQLIGDLEAARAAAWARLTAPAAAKPSEALGQEARNLDVAEAAKRLGMSRDWLSRGGRTLWGRGQPRRRSHLQAQGVLALLDPIQRPRPPVPRARRQDPGCRQEEAPAAAP